ncbi:MAG: helix-turn-helix domain-containing protein [Thermomicrobiales bacterium]
MDPRSRKPTSSETALAQRQQMVQLHHTGWTYAAIAAHLGCSRWTVGRWVRAHAAGGDAALAYHDRRPHTPHPQTTPLAVQEQIRTIRQAHPGWGARLIRRQLELDGVAAVPSEVTIHQWLGRFGFPLVRPARHKPLGWASPPPTPAIPVWQTDFKQKRGRGP